MLPTLISTGARITSTRTFSSSLVVLQRVSNPPCTHTFTTEHPKHQLRHQLNAYVSVAPGSIKRLEEENDKLKEAVAEARKRASAKVEELVAAYAESMDGCVDRWTHARCDCGGVQATAVMK